MKLSPAQTQALKNLAKGHEQIQARSAKALKANGLITTDGIHMSDSGWVRANLTDKGRQELEQA